jgi:hypothetical protein
MKRCALVRLSRARALPSRQTCKEFFHAHRIRRTWSRKVHKFLKSSCKIQLSQGLSHETIDENMDSYEVGLASELNAPKARP